MGGELEAEDDSETDFEEKNEYITYLIRNEGKYLKKLWPNLKKEKSNIRIKLIKEIKLPFEVTTFAKHLEYVDKIKTILFNCYSKIFCLKWPELIRIPDYEEILNWHKDIQFISYQENTNRLYVQYYEEQEHFISIYTFKNNKIIISGFVDCIKYGLKDLIDISDNKSIALNYWNNFNCQCLQFMDNEYKIIKNFNEYFYSILACPKKDKFIAVTKKNNIVLINAHNFEYIAVLKKTFFSTVCILGKKYLIAQNLSTEYIEIYNLTNLKLLNQLRDIHLDDDRGVYFYKCTKSEYFFFINNVEFFMAEFKNNSLNVVCSIRPIFYSTSILYLNDYLLVAEEGKTAIFKKIIT